MVSPIGNDKIFILACKDIFRLDCYSIRKKELVIRAKNLYGEECDVEHWTDCWGFPG